MYLYRYSRKGKPWHIHRPLYVRLCLRYIDDYRQRRACDIHSFSFKKCMNGGQYITPKITHSCSRKYHLTGSVGTLFPRPDFSVNANRVWPGDTLVLYYPQENRGSDCM